MASARRVLVVEDEAIVAIFLEELLTDLGYQVAGVLSHLKQAMARANDENFDFAILDVHLAGEDVFPFADALAARGIPFVFMSGLGKQEIPERLRDRPTLQKPFRPEEVSKAIAALVT